MLQFFREKLSKVVIWIIAGAIILFFILSAGSYLFNATYNNTVVKVDGDSIDLDIVNQNYQKELQKNYNKFNDLTFDSQKLKQNILNELINQFAVIKGLQRQGFLITDEQLIDLIDKEPKFQEKGKFSRQKYSEFLKTVKISNNNYQNFLRQYLLLDQFRSSLLLSNFIIPQELNNFLYKWFQTRDFGYVIIPRNKFINKSINNEEINSYYNSNKSKLIFPEKAKIVYIDLDANKLSKQINIDKSELYTYYQQHPEYYTLPELVNVRHILIPFSSTDDKNNNQEQQQANNILSQIKAGDSFQELAKKYSKDPGSASKGGDLGWIGKGEIDDNFEAAAFALNKPGDLSEVFKSKFGYHIIQLIEKRLAKLSTFEEVIEKVTQHYKEDKIQPKINESYEKLLHAGSSNYDLEKLSKELDLTLNTSEYFSKNEVIKGIDNSKILTAAVFNQKKLNTNSEVIKLSKDHFVLFRLVDKQPQKEKTLEEAYLEIKDILNDRYAAEEMNQYTEDFLIKLQKYKISPSNFAKIKGLKWNNLSNITKNSKNINEEILHIAFSFNQLNISKKFNLSNGDSLILQITQIKDADINKLTAEIPDFKNNIENKLLQLRSYLEQKLYEQYLFDNAKIKWIRSIDQL